MSSRIHHESISVTVNTAIEIASNQFEMVYSSAGSMMKKSLLKERKKWISTRARYIQINGARREWLDKFLNRDEG